MKRSLLGCTEECVYVLVEDTKTGVAHWYTLNRRTKRNMVENRLVPILSLPPMPISATTASYVVVGSNIFVMGGKYGYHVGPPSSIALCIDCRTHTARRVADVPVVDHEKAIKFIDEKIHLLGSAADGRESLVLVVFDSRTETWEPGRRSVWELDFRWLRSFSELAGKDIFRKTNHGYKLREGTWEMDEIMKYHLWGNECVMGNILYVYDGYKYILRRYDIKQRTWGVVKGLEKLPLGDSRSHIVSCGKMLILFLTIVDDDDPSVLKNKIWCVEISVERREDGEIRGKVECCDLLLDGCFAITKCLLVTL